INYRSLPKIVPQMLRPYSCQLLVGAKHLEDKLSVIAKNSSPNASPVQLSVVSCKTVTNYLLPITNYQLPIPLFPCFCFRNF
ncbi:hypothetical protein VB638_03815, partial [Dolichospermum sp. UHCC 0684]|nr:hypothetical protein [Dolichospermum sp. UHCC 0684]